MICFVFEYYVLFSHFFLCFSWYLFMSCFRIFCLLLHFLMFLLKSFNILLCFVMFCFVYFATKLCERDRKASKTNHARSWREKKSSDQLDANLWPFQLNQNIKSAILLHLSSGLIVSLRFRCFCLVWKNMCSHSLMVRASRWDSKHCDALWVRIPLAAYFLMLWETDVIWLKGKKTLDGGRNGETDWGLWG